jgi:hypothetical protein
MYYCQLPVVKLRVSAKGQVVAVYGRNLEKMKNDGLPRAVFIGTRNDGI